MIRTRARIRLVASLIAIALGSAGTALAAPGRTLLAHDVHTYATSELDPLLLPTDVAVGPSGEVYVADGVNGRVVAFGPDGSVLRVIREVADVALVNPTGLAVTDDGDLWICDAFLHGVLVQPPGRRAGRALPIDPTVGEALDLTDIAVSPDGLTVWLVDNEGHGLVRGDVATGEWLRFGAYGEATGQLQFPYMVALAPDGTAYATDVLNGRVQGFDAQGVALRPLARYGVTPGQLYRPKGVAVQGDNVWVSDSTLGVIQVFTRRGKLVDVLRDAQGSVLRLDTPTGLAISGDRLFVVELSAGRVRELRIEKALGLPFEVTGGTSIGADAAQGRDCTACHLEMMPALARGLGNALVPPPENPAAQPYVSREQTCLSCHDGTVIDSRRKVWALHGHPTGTAPPEDMKVPAALPLSDGKLTCRTCHSAHSLGGSGYQHREALMLRVTDRANELCLACHGDMSGGGGK